MAAAANQVGHVGLRPFSRIHTYDPQKAQGPFPGRPGKPHLWIVPGRTTLVPPFDKPDRNSTGSSHGLS
jgi:hypothetical protein